MIFSIGVLLFLAGYIWYRGTEYSKDWRDTIQFVLMVFGSTLVTSSLLILAWKYLP